MPHPLRAPVRLALLLLSLAASAPAAWAQATGEPTVVFLVRHAEKAAAPAADPPLTDEGAERARLLAQLLGDAGLDAVLSTDTERTRATAAPTAEAAGRDVGLYDPRRLDELAARLRALAGAGERTLVVGHSNTTPELVRLLGGEPGTAIDEPAEYDRLYVLTLPAGGPTTTLLLRYGRPFHR